MRKLVDTLRRPENGRSVPGFPPRVFPLSRVFSPWLEHASLWFDTVSGLPRQVRHMSTPVRTIAINSAAAGACAGLALLWFGVAFAAEDAHAEDRVSTKLVLSLIALIIVLLGVGTRAASKRFPWLAATLTPLIVGGIMGLQPDREVYLGLQLGACAAAAFLLGALGLQLERWARGRTATNASNL
jgi:hypothetical protein